MSAVPVIETARLRLRAFRHGDLEAHAAMLGNPEVARHLGNFNFSREDSWRRLAAAIGMWPLLGYGYWAVEPREGGGYLGLTGFADFKRAITPSIEGIPEMGWIYDSPVHGQGIAFEAAEAALRWAEQNLSCAEAVAIIDPANQPSIRLARRLGFGDETQVEYGEETVLLVRRPLPAAAAAPSSTAA